jgi:Electron transfer DM13
LWCEQAGANFGEVLIPTTLPTNLDAVDDSALLLCSASGTSIGTFVTRAHNVTGEVVVLSERVLEIRGFVYDGAAPAVHFWADTNANPSSTGFRLYDGEPTNGCGMTAIQNSADGTVTYRVEFPGNSSILDILGGSISVWCEQFSANFGEVSQGCLLYCFGLYPNFEDI